ncbi:hypothetical protein AB0K11_18060 [Mycobacterium sp. NPDC050551]|uniref:SecDF P1 head subdomain-containing protein n=1 Tax=Mycobacterium sp. NPDC050551 TaxID=3155407 RepID=UPI003421E1E9
MSMAPPPGGPWPPTGTAHGPWQPAPPPAPKRALRWLVIAMLAVIVCGYAFALVLTRDRWAPGATSGDRTELTLRPAPGSSASADSLERARGVLEARAAARGGRGARATVSDDAIILSVPGTDDEWGDIGAAGRLDLRPVIHATEAQSAGGPTDRPKTPSPQAVADEKQLRQSADPSIQLLALQFQATRCGDNDALAGRDDPDQPLVTCSQDGKTVYLLGKTIIDGESIQSAGREYDEGSRRWVVDLEFDSAGAGRWAQFTASNIGTQVAFTLDTAVLSAPEIMEAMPGGRTQIAGNFTEDDARDLAAALQGGALPFPLTLESSTTETVPLQDNSTAWRIGLLAAGAVVVALVIGGVLLVVGAGRGRGAAPGYAADVTRYTS